MQQPHVDFHDDWIHTPTLNGKKMWIWGVALFMALLIVFCSRLHEPHWMTLEIL